METQNNQPKQKNMFSLISGLLFIGLGGYIIYNHFFVDSVVYSNMRLILAFAIVGFGLFRLYGYFKTE